MGRVRLEAIRLPVHSGGRSAATRATQAAATTRPARGASAAGRRYAGAHQEGEAQHDQRDDPVNRTQGQAHGPAGRLLEQRPEQRRMRVGIGADRDDGAESDERHGEAPVAPAGDQAQRHGDRRERRS